MPASSVRSFADPDEYATSIRASKIQLAITGRGNFATKLVRVDLHQLWLQRLDDNLPRIAHAANLKGRAIITFRSGSGPELLRNGRPMEPFELWRCAESQESYSRSTEQAINSTMSLPIEDMVKFGAEMAGFDLAPPVFEQIVTPPPDA